VGIRIAGSAVIELTFLGLGLLGAPRLGYIATLGDAHPDLAARLRAFWADDLPWLGDLMVIADRTATLEGEDPEPLFAAMLAGVPGGEVRLETETAEERAAVAARLDALRADAALRARYAALLREVWERCGAVAIAERAGIVRTVVAWRERLAAGERVLDLLHAKHIARWPQFAAIVAAGERDGSILLTPGVTCTGGSIVALEHTLSIAAPLLRHDALEQRRLAAAEVAGRLKVLSDPTRVALVSLLACEPATVTDLAALLGLADDLGAHPPAPRGRPRRCPARRRADDLRRAARAARAAARRNRGPAAAVVPLGRR
jgi:hypothetical protein